MINKAIAALAATCVIIALPGCAAKPITVEEGSVRVQAAQINARLVDGLTVKAVTEDAALADMTAYVNEALKKAGYNQTAGDDKVTYTISEVYAGPASEYKEAHTAVGNAVATGASVAVSLTTCLLLSSCSDPGVLGNNVTSGLTAASDAAQNTNGQNVDNLAGTNLVIHTVCQNFRGCASSAAASSDPSMTLDDLRMQNAKLGIPRTMRIGE
ncbi:hypothetical protein LU689_26960 [Pseudomonas asiatica]|uniref:hypothetical protein n=1 Tax=Pseudomonas asiatica TaxID=2219225 RepID=UPI001E34E695|nr:hypothetical protein [Pseudomonas asiatica]MCE0853547.1 hypothetical protein [Pseudomonas asiatica]